MKFISRYNYPHTKINIMFKIKYKAEIKVIHKTNVFQYVNTQA